MTDSNEQRIEASVAASDARHRPTSSARVALGVVAILLFGTLTFVGVSLLVRVPENTDAIHDICVESNRRTALVNEKFAQLNALFDASIKRSQAEGRTTPPEVLTAYEQYKQPIPIRDCKKVTP